MKTSWKPPLAAGVVLAALTGASAGAGASPDAGAAQGCVPRTNVEAIVDDSGSMAFNDSNDLRIRAMELFIDTQGNEKRTLGAVEFGSDATPLFGPGLIGQDPGGFKAALNAALVEDGGATDYNAAFAAAGAHNPNANARIFLTDGEHTDDPAYAEGHRGGPPVYVIGLGAGAPGGPSDELLKRIAGETGGLYSRADDASGLQAAMFELNTAIACQAPPKRFSDSFIRTGQTASHRIAIPRRVNTAQFALSWEDAEDAFTIGGFRVVRRGKVVGKASQRRVRRLKVSRRRGATFTTVRVSRLVRGKLRFEVRAKRLSTPGVPVDLTTQVSRTRR